MRSLVVERCVGAILTVVFGVLINFIRAKRRGRSKEPEVLPDSDCGYGQVVKKRAGRCLGLVIRRVVFGVEELFERKQLLTLLLKRPERDNHHVRSAQVPKLIVFIKHNEST